MSYKYYILPLVLLAAIPAGCTKNAVPDSDVISFSVQVEDGTKAAGQFTASDLSSLNTFKVSGYDGSSKIIDNKTVYKTGGAWLFKDNPRAWISGHTMTFFADANMPSWASVSSASSTSSTLSVTEIPTAAADQWDPLVGYYSGKGSNGNATITFYHPMTAVEFKTGNLGEAQYGITGIVSVKLTGVFKGGSAAVTGGTSGLSYNWTPSGTKSVTGPFTGTKSTKPFLLIPQDLESNNVTLEIVVSRSSGGNKTMNAKLASGQWLAGKKNTYTLDYVNNQFGGTITVTLTDWGTVSSSSSEHPDYFDANYD